SVVITIQNYVFTSAASDLTAKLRTLSFRAILRQDIQFFDRPENNVNTLTSLHNGMCADSTLDGALTSRVNDNPQKVEGLAGVTLGAFVSGP
ncbi:hypothetical protein EDD15DRAFT_2285648, partial [Pisolithus albus]